MEVVNINTVLFMSCSNVLEVNGFVKDFFLSFPCFFDIYFDHLKNKKCYYGTEMRFFVQIMPDTIFYFPKFLMIFFTPFIVDLYETLLFSG